jgi:hypothetical protein
MSGESRDFVVRNINKCILGAGDARLIARHAYAWRAEERAKALGDSLYGAAVEWKFRPSETPVCDWEKAREAWLGALADVFGVSGPSGDSRSHRSLRNAVRWLVRRRSVGDLARSRSIPSSGFSNRWRGASARGALPAMH